MDQNRLKTELPIRLSQDAIEEFKKIYQEEYGRTLSDAEAIEMSQRLLRLFQIIYHPLPSDQHPTEHKDPPNY